MPHLVYRKRYWRVAGDEFSLPAFCSIIGRIFWTILIAIIFAFSINRLTQCGAGWIFILYLTISIAIFITSIYCEVMLMIVSLRGSIIESERRRDLGQFLNLKLLLGFFQFLVAIFGVISVTVQSQIPCNEDFEGSELNYAFVVTVTISQLFDVASMLCCCYLFRANRIDHEDEEPRDKDWAINTWETRCRTLTRSVQILSCNMFGGGNITEGLDEVARLLTDFFHHAGFLDVVPSDVVAGIILVRMEQRSIRKAKRAKMRLSTSSLDIETGDGAADDNGSSKRGVLKMRRNNNSRNELGTSGTVDGVSGSAMRTLVSGSSNADMSFKHLDLDVETLETIYRCAVFSVAMYSHIIAMYLRPCTGVCRICVRGSCGPTTAQHSRCSRMFCCCCGSIPGSCFRPNSTGRYYAGNDNDANCVNGSNGVRSSRLSMIDGDNFCGLNHTGLSQIITDNLSEGLLGSELVYASFRNDPLHKVHAVFLDHVKERVVIAIRGTLSMEDCVTDAICDPIELSSIGEEYGFDGTGRYAHAGMLKAALHIRSELDNHDLLERVLGSNTVGSTIKTPLNECYGGCSHYSLVVTGHSLGAGSAVILGLLLRKRFPTVHVYAYGTPGSVLDSQLSKEVSSFVTSIVMGNDLVCRLSFPSLNRLREDVLDAISRAKVNKMLIMQAIFKEFNSDDFMYPKGEEPDSAFKTSIQQFKAKIQERVPDHVRLSIPGRVIHFAKDGVERVCCRNRVVYAAREAEIDEFYDIVMSTTMASDHLPDMYLNHVHDAWQKKLRTMTV